MSDINPASATEPPSARPLFRSTVIAVGVAVALLATVVLPAEYGVDPTGVGAVLGLTDMGEIKVALAREAAMADSVETIARQAGAADAAVPRAAVGPGATRPVASSAPPDGRTSTTDSSANSHVTEIFLGPNEGKEVKLVMRKYARVTFAWSTDRGVVNYDTHADAPGIRYHGYAKGTGKASDEGVLVAAFGGAHGWFWRNRGSDVVRVTLRTTGDYQELKRM